jgi:hypothetical protein
MASQRRIAILPDLLDGRIAAFHRTWKVGGWAVVAAELRLARLHASLETARQPRGGVGAPFLEPRSSGA